MLQYSLWLFPASSYLIQFMNIHVLKHVPFEGPAAIATWAESHDHQVDIVPVYEGGALPEPREVQFLVVMGGPMSVGDEDDHPWLKTEKQFIRHCIDQSIPVLGVCLGAQLIAEVLGAPVTKNAHREIGWFPLSVNPVLKSTAIADIFPDGLNVFHWHGDTFAIPPGAVLIASSEACRNQGFIVNDRIVALQFHIETTPQSASALIENCADELDGSQYVQSGAEMVAGPQRFDTVNRVVYQLLDRLAAAAR